MAAPLLLLALLSPLAACGGQAEPGPPAGAADPASGDAPSRDGPVGEPTGEPTGATTGPATSTALVCAEPEKDFGIVWQGAVLHHEFELTAAADGPLRIEEVIPDCGCTAPRLEVSGPDGARRAYALGAPIQPGERLHLAVRYDTTGKFDTVPRSITLRGPEPLGLARVSVRADVRPWLNVTPQHVRLPRQRGDEATEADYEVRSSDQSAFLLTPTGAGVPDSVTLTATPVEPGDDGRASVWNVHVQLGPGLPRGPHGYPIHLEADVVNEAAPVDPDGPPPFHRATAFVAVHVVGPVSIEPPNLVLGMVSGAETVSRTVRVACHDPEFELPEPVVRLEPLRPGEDLALARTAVLSTRRVEGENAWDVQLLLEGLDPEVPRSVMARLVVETGHPGEPLLEAPITGFHREGVR